MAVKTRTIRIMWENESSFQMDTRLDDGDWITVESIDENDYFESLWETGTKPKCLKYFASELETIGAEMKA